MQVIDVNLKIMIWKRGGEESFSPAPLFHPAYTQSIIAGWLIGSSIITFLSCIYFGHKRHQEGSRNQNKV